MRDTPAHVLTDHLTNTRDTGSDLYSQYILNPRVSSELLTPYRSFFLNNMPKADQMKENPQLLVDWIKSNIKINNKLNPQHIPVMPIGVWKARIADAGSRNVFFITAARSLGIPARLEPVAQKVQYHNGTVWVDVNFDTGSTVIADQSQLLLSYNPTKTFDDPRYGSHFSISRVQNDGTLQHLNLRTNTDVDMGGGSTLAALMSNPPSVDKGHYMLVSGTRLASGGVLADVKFFDIIKNKDNQIVLTMRESADDITVIGNFNSENSFKLAESKEEQSVLQVTGRGYFVVALLGSRQEPTNHAMRDIASVKEQLEKWGRSMIMLFPSEQGYNNFDSKEFGALPNTITYGVDINGSIQKEIVANMKLSNPNSLPIFIIADTFNRVVFVSQGYTIGLGEQMVKVINKL